MTQSAEHQIAAPGAAFAEAFVEADGFRIRYRAAGTGDVVVSFHGAGGLRLSGVHDLLAERYRVVAFEVPGFGDSPVNERSKTMQNLATTMRQAVAALGIQRYNLIANAFTAKLALWMAIQEPDAVPALVLLAPSAIKLEGERPAATTEAEKLALLFAHPERQPPLPPLSPEIDAKQRALIQRLSGPKRDAALEAAMAELKIPVLALFGTKDRLNPPELAHFYREILPNCHLIMIYDAAHALDADRPEAVFAVVADFLKHQDRFLVNYESALIHP